ncbi:MAG: hypothetical protein HC822_08105 [Oscillochloris sp.]|nr:hypothetical protein [Oscillochloris sp.]
MLIDLLLARDCLGVLYLQIVIARVLQIVGSSLPFRRLPPAVRVLLRIRRQRVKPGCFVNVPWIRQPAIQQALKKLKLTGDNMPKRRVIHIRATNRL